MKWIEEGEQVELTKRGRVVARLIPPPPAGTRRKFQAPDFEAMQREILGDDLAGRMLTPEDSAFIRAREER